jgi:plasmid stability protein
MAQLVVRNLADDVKARLKERARRHGHSLEAEAREILRVAVNEEPPLAEPGLGTQIAALFRGKGFKGEIQEVRGYPVQPAKFDE